MKKLLSSQGMTALATVVLLVFGATNAAAQSEINAEGSAKNEAKNSSPGISFRLEELVDAAVRFNYIEPEITIKRKFQIDDTFHSFFLSESCKLQTTTVTLLGAFEHFDPPPHRVEYVFEFLGTVKISTEYPWGADDITVPDTRGHMTVMDVLDPFSEPPPAPRDSLHVELEPNPYNPGAPTFLCNLGLEVTVSVEE